MQAKPGLSTKLALTMAALLLGAAAAPAVQAHGSNNKPRHDQAWGKRPLSLKAMGSFAVGGDIVVTDAATSTPGGAFGAGSNDGHVAVNQMYVQHYVPTNSDRHIPVVLIHGGTLSGSSYETTPDGRMGWVEYFLREDRAVYLPDQASRGRSGFDVAVINRVKMGLQPVSTLPSMFVFTQEQGWKTFRFGPERGVTFPGLKYPVSAADELSKQTIPDLNGMLPSPNPTYAALATLAKDVKGAILIGHSESGLFPQQAALSDPKGIKGLVSLEPGACTGAIPTAAEVKKLAKIPTLIVFGDFIDQAGSTFPNWPAALAGCQTYVQTINKAGGKATLVQLPKIGIKGNSHMLMQDKNNLEVADLILSWIEKTVERSHR
jgi:pimeloyl-ACP methyl ester carboxylesterase